MQGILDNPDAAYAKLKEMGKGLFGQNGAGLGAAIGSLLGGQPAAGGQQGGAGGQGAAGSQQPGSPLGGQLGETLGNLLQQGLGGLGQSQGQGGARPGGQRSIPSRTSPAEALTETAPTEAAPTEPAPPVPPSDDRAAGQSANERGVAAAFQPVSCSSRASLIPARQRRGAQPSPRISAHNSGLTMSAGSQLLPPIRARQAPTPGLPRQAGARDKPMRARDRGARGSG